MEILLSIRNRGLILPARHRSEWPTVIGIGLDIPERLVGDDIPKGYAAALDFASFMQQQLEGRLFPEWAIDQDGRQLVDFAAGPYPTTFTVPQAEFR